MAAAKGLRLSIHLLSGHAAPLVALCRALPPTLALPVSDLSFFWRDDASTHAYTESLISRAASMARLVILRILFCGNVSPDVHLPRLLQSLSHLERVFLDMPPSAPHAHSHVLSVAAIIHHIPQLDIVSFSGMQVPCQLRTIFLRRHVAVSCVAAAYWLACACPDKTSALALLQAFPQCSITTSCASLDVFLRATSNSSFPVNVDLKVASLISSAPS